MPCTTPRLIWCPLHNLLLNVLKRKFVWDRDSLLCSDFRALGLSQQGRHTQGIHLWKSKGRPESFPPHLEKDRFVETPALREVSLLLLAPSPISQPQEGKQRPGPIPQQIFDFSFTALRRNQGETHETWAAASCFSEENYNNCKNREWKILRFRPFPQQHAWLMTPNQLPSETSVWEGGCLLWEGSFPEGMGEQAWTLHLERSWLRGSQVEERVGRSYTWALYLQLQELGWWKQNEQEEVVHCTAGWRCLPKGVVAAQISPRSMCIWMGVWKRPPLGVLAGWNGIVGKWPSSLERLGMPL